MLFRMGLCPVGPDNDQHIVEQAALATKIVIAWGKSGEDGPDRDKVLTRRAEVLQLLEGYELYRFAAEAVSPRKGDGGDGSPPWHPLYLPPNTPIVPYP